MRAAFGEFELDEVTFELRRAGTRVAMEPQVFDVLAHLVHHHDRVVTKEELLDSVWGDRFVSESALTSRIRAVRRALGDDRQTQRYVQTVHGRGYRFIADVRTPDAGAGAEAVAAFSTHNLPAERTPLFGRKGEICSVAERIDEHRLVSLLGIGGTGKTRLAAAVGRHLLDRFEDGVWFTDLVPVRDQRSVDTALAHAAGVALSPGDGRGQLAAAIDHRDALFVLDNCEHVREQVVVTLDHLLEHTSRPRFLVTSREPLGLPDEWRMAVDPLDIGDEHETGPAVELFVASAERFGATVGGDDLDAVRRICRHLDGLPLAVELAAAQLRALAPADVLARLDERFELLHACRAPGRERQASLQAVLEDTWTMIESDEQQLLGRLGAFPGPFDLRDAEQLCAEQPGSTARTLGRLADHSLVVPDTGERRHRLLETVRLFTRQHGDHNRHATRHADWCLERVGRDVGLHLHDFPTAVWCHRHWDDLRAAERHLLRFGRPADAALAVAAPALAMHVDLGARAADTLRRLDDHLARTDDPALAARLHLTGVFSAMATRSPAAIAHHGHAAVIAAQAAADELLLSIALVLASWSTIFEDTNAALAMVEDAARRAEAVGDPQARDLADAYRVFHLSMQRRYDEALELAEVVVSRAPPADAYGQATLVAITGLASITVLSDPRRAATWIDDLLTRPSPEHTMWANLVLVSSIQASNGKHKEAVGLLDRVRARLVKAGQDWLPDLLVPAAVLAHRAGDDERAARWLRAVRDAGRPTQSFQATCVYRRMRETVGVAATSPLADASLDEVGEEAFTWMHDLA